MWGPKCIGLVRVGPLCCNSACQLELSQILSLAIGELLVSTQNTTSDSGHGTAAAPEASPFRLA